MINRLILEGRLVKEPEEIKGKTESTSCCTFTIAQSGSKEDEVLYINAVAFSYNAKYILKYLGKGSRVIVEGKLTTNTYKEKKYFKLVVDSVEGILEGKRERTVDDEIVDCAEEVANASR